MIALWLGGLVCVAAVVLMVFIIWLVREVHKAELDHGYFLGVLQPPKTRLKMRELREKKNG